MFSLFSGLWQYFFAPQNYHVLIIGLDNAGKTTLLERIKTNFGTTHGLPPEKIAPTIGMNLAKIRYQGAQIIFWDLGGQARMRSMWEKYYMEANAVVFVVDSADIGRLDEAKVAFDRVLDDESMVKSATPVITLANKQDLEDALAPGDLVMNFCSHIARARTGGGSSTTNDLPSVFGVSALTSNGLDIALAHIVASARAHRQRSS